MGITPAVAVISITQVIRAGRERREDRAGAACSEPGMCKHPICHQDAQVRGYCIKHLGRGDFPLWICLTPFFVAAAYPIVLAKTLFPLVVSTSLLVVILLLAFVYAPIMSFVSARLDGLIGQNI